MNKLAKRAAVGLSIVALGGAAAAFGNEVGSAIGSIGDPSPSDATQLWLTN